MKPLVILLSISVASCTATKPVTAPGAVAAGKRVEARRGMVAASSADASAAGLSMLQRGGNAVDAAVATAFALGVVDHSQTGIGGYGVATIWLAKEKRAEVLEFMGRTGADPAWGAVDPDTTGPINPRIALVPGFVSGLMTMHERYGKLPRADVLAPAVRLARDGFVVGPLMHRVLTAQRDKVAATPAAAAVFLPNGQVPAVGDRIVQPELASILEAIGRDGAPAFYSGEYARKTTEQIRAAGGLVTEADFAAYKPMDRRPACSPFLEYTVIGAGGSVASPYVIEMLNVAEASGVHRMGDPTNTPEAAARLADAISIGVQDLRAYGGGPEWRPSPVRGVSSPAFAAARAAWRPGPVSSGERPDAWTFDAGQAPARCAALNPYASTPRTGTESTLSGEVIAEAATNTSHLSVVDADRNVVSLTSSVGILFGSGVYAGGMFLNSSGNLFRAGTRAPNRYPSSSVAPMIVLEGNSPRFVVGAAGAAYIPGAVAQVIFRVAGLRQDVYAAVAAPRMNPQAGNQRLEVEAGYALPVYQQLRAHGYVTSTRIADLLFAAVHAVAIRPDGTLVGAADPRRDGAAAGY
jgi:gamma-glutamyltranspeptidase/glutathione hydrolase